MGYLSDIMIVVEKFMAESKDETDILAIVPSHDGSEKFLESIGAKKHNGFLTVDKKLAKKINRVLNPRTFLVEGYSQASDPAIIEWRRNRGSDAVRDILEREAAGGVGLETVRQNITLEDFSEAKIKRDGFGKFAKKPSTNIGKVPQPTAITGAIFGGLANQLDLLGRETVGVVEQIDLLNQAAVLDKWTPEQFEMAKALLNNRPTFASNESAFEFLQTTLADMGIPAKEGMTFTVSEGSADELGYAGVYDPFTNSFKMSSEFAKNVRDGDPAAIHVMAHEMLHSRQIDLDATLDPDEVRNKYGVVFNKDAGPDDETNLYSMVEGANDLLTQAVMGTIYKVPGTNNAIQQRASEALYGKTPSANFSLAPYDQAANHVAALINASVENTGNDPFTTLVGVQQQAARMKKINDWTTTIFPKDEKGMYSYGGGTIEFPGWSGLNPQKYFADRYPGLDYDRAMYLFLRGLGRVDLEFDTYNVIMLYDSRQVRDKFGRWSGSGAGSVSAKMSPNKTPLSQGGGVGFGSDDTALALRVRVGKGQTVGGVDFEKFSKGPFSTRYTNNNLNALGQTFKPADLGFQRTWASAKPFGGGLSLGPFSINGRLTRSSRGGVRGEYFGSGLFGSRYVSRDFNAIGTGVGVASLFIGG